VRHAAGFLGGVWEIMPGPEAGEAPEHVESLRPGSPLALPGRDGLQHGGLRASIPGAGMPPREDESFIIDVIREGCGSIL
jgi:hypothetical protein